jgi:glycerophosphoryl diester phosphodiesterase
MDSAASAIRLRDLRKTYVVTEREPGLRAALASRVDAKYAREGVPTLAEVLAVAKGRLGVVIELKFYGHNQSLEEKVAALVEAAGGPSARSAEQPVRRRRRRTAGISTGARIRRPG